jgi:hypothetical protein
VIVLVIVCIATATLLVWLVVEFGRLMRADRGGLAVDRLVHGVAGGMRGAAGRFGVSGGGEGGSVGRGGTAVAEAPEPQAPEEVADADIAWVRHDAEVEDLVRERLYGDRRRRRD